VLADYAELLQRVHQRRDGVIQIFAKAAHLFDFVDGVKRGGVVLADC
jgi:hypothetical protein